MIGERLSALRRERGVTQETLARALEVTKYTISSYEKDRSTPSDEIKVAIARYFNVSLDYLLGLIDQPLSYDRERNIVVLPHGLPGQVKEKVSEYVDYLAYCHHQTVSYK